MKIEINKTNLYYSVFLLAALVILFANYPRLYGVDAFEIMWMAQALKEGALFSENTWLIHPLSYFGYYPFSHRGILVPMVLAFIISILEFLSFGIFGLNEAILIFNIIIILIIYKTSRKLGETLFQEEWSQIVFVAAILFSVNFINDYTMTVSTRIIISISMLILLNLSLKFLKKDFKIEPKTILLIIIIFLISSLAHRLWLNSLLTIIFVIFTLIIRKYKKLHPLSVSLILPIAIVVFFFGFEYFGLERYGFSADANLLELSLFLSIYYVIAIGLIIIVFPFGVLIVIYKLTFSFNDFNPFIPKKSESHTEFQQNSTLRDQFYYLLLFLIPFFFFMFTTFYAVVIFLPIIIIFSVQGLVYIKNYLSTITFFSKKIEWALPLLIIFTLSGFYLLNLDYYSKIALTEIILLITLLFALFIFIFLISNHFNRIQISFRKIDFSKLKNFLWMVLLSLSVLASSIINVEISKYSVFNNPYPWDNRYFTDEEAQLVDYFINEDISGLIFVADHHIARRIAGVGFLPAVSESTFIGTALFYEIISPDYVIENTKFSILGFFELNFFNFTQMDPINALRNNIAALDLRVEIDLDTFLSYNIQYVITINETFYSGGINNWPLIQSLKLSKAYNPVFVTLHFLVWKIF